MTRKEAAEKLKSLWYFLTNNDYPQKDLDALQVAIKALEQELRDCKTCIHSDKGKCAGTEECHECMWESKYEQEPVLGKIRAEIDEQYDRVYPYDISCAEGLELALGIIDKYKAESEEV